MSQEAQMRSMTSSSGGPGRLYLLVFVLTGLAVYGWAWRHSRPAAIPQGGTAAATVTVEPRAQGEPGQPALLLPDAAALRSQVLSEQNIARALANSDEQWSAPRSMARIRAGLQMGSHPTEHANGIATSFALTDDDQALASGVVNAVAGHYAEGCRAKFRDDAQRNHAAAATALADARQKLRLVKAELEGYLERHFHEQEDAARKAIAYKGAAPAVPQNQTAPAKPAAVDNPEWVRVYEQLQAKRQSLAEMLKVRTPLHPEVQALQSDIGDLERTISSTPREIARQEESRPASPAAPAIVGGSVPGPAAEEQIEAARTFASLAAPLKKAAENETRLAEAERIAWQEQFRLPEVKLFPATALPGSRPAPGARMLWVALIAALAVTSGLAMILNRPANDRLLESAEQAKQVLSVPVLGVVGIADLSDEPAPQPGTHPGTRLAWTLGGLSCIAAALLLVMIAVA